ncbi:uncharacterized protein LOC129602052 isoform X2 [Paramacrobiotus metropolitanus]|uniref:uncharacterized protein LOC129602052 isoform X2 n=1 Tax=Paramacrobiotus metropolitanus TaxID=2943436 RepID=UPI002446197D|nr:uncharacterized protein LOC129602052 isoform X2 [Paramacrobiotus metropolitanus]
MKATSGVLPEYLLTAITAGVWPFFLLMPGFSALKCSFCPQNTGPKLCLDPSLDTVATCPPNQQTCVVVSGYRARPNSTDKNALVPTMYRQCSGPPFIQGDAEKWAVVQSKGKKLLCFLMERSDFGVDPTLPGVPTTRRCICGHDSCNTMTWDEVMTQFTMPVNFTAADVPKQDVLGNNALTDVLAKLNASDVAPPGAGISAAPAGTEGPVAAVTSALAANDSSLNGNDTSSAGPAAASGGSNMGLIAGAVGGVIALAALAGGLYYWFKIRKRKDSTGGDSGTAEGAVARAATVEALRQARTMTIKGHGLVVFSLNWKQRFSTSVYC